MKRLLAWALAAVMCWTGAACAEEALPQMDGLEKLLNALTDTMYAQERTAFDSNAEDQPGVAYGLIWRLLYRGLLNVESADGEVRLSETKLSEIYDQMFAAGAFVLPDEDCCEAITRTEDGLAFDVSTASVGMAGMQIAQIAAGEQDDAQRLVLELYHIDEDYYMQDEESLLNAKWYGSAVVDVQRDENAPFGWKIIRWSDAKDLAESTLNSMAGPEMQEYVSDALGFRVMYPAAITQVQETAAGVQGQSADGRVTLQVSVEAADCTLAEALVRYTEEDAIVNVHEDQQYFTVSVQRDELVTTRVVLLAEGRLAVAALTYPAEDMEIYAACAEGMENSFTLTAQSVG